MSKGSTARPFGVERATFANNFDAIFGRKKPVGCVKCPRDEARTCGYCGMPQEALSAPAYGLDDGRPKEV